jgi:hypothetical protein
MLRDARAARSFGLVGGEGFADDEVRGGSVSHIGSSGIKAICQAQSQTILISLGKPNPIRPNNS